MAAAAAFSSADLCELFFCAIEASFVIGGVVGGEVGRGVGGRIVGGAEQHVVERQPGRGAYDEPEAERQEADVTGITYPVVKHSYLVKDTDEIPRVTREALLEPSSNRGRMPE